MKNPSPKQHKYHISILFKPKHKSQQHIVFTTKEKKMKNPSPSKDSTTTNTTPPPSSPPQHPLTGGDDVVDPTPTEVTNPTGSEEGKTEEAAGEMFLKTPAQVLEELAGSDDSGNGNGDGGSGSGSVSIPLGSGGGGAMAVAVAVGVGGGGGTVKSDKRKGGGAVELVVKEKETKKPRLTEVKDPPSGTPTCPICHRQFQTWKGAFGHMRSHPDREYRGFFRPPVFGSSSSPSVPATEAPPSNADNDNNKGADIGEASKELVDAEKKGDEEPKRGVVFDLNNPMMEGEGSSSGAAAAAGGNNAPGEAIVEERVVQEEGRNLRGFDLNEMPKDDDDE